MDFLNKLYESNYFGIGLFAVISFLVVTFLIVLFFGKKDEKKRKLESTNLNTFKETSSAIKLETPVTPVSLEQPEPVAPVSPIEPVMPVNFEEPVAPVAPINIEPVSNIVEEPVETPVMPNIDIPVTPVAPVVPNISEPINIEPVKYDIPVSKDPVVMEPIKITIPDTPSVTETVEPVIKEEVSPLITEPTIVDAPVINDTYYKPVETPESENVSVPSIDFDAIAKSISKELDELEKNTNHNTYEEIKVTPVSEISRPTNNQFSSVYVTEPVRRESVSSVELPKRIDLPTKKDDEN